MISNDTFIVLYREETSEYKLSYPSSIQELHDLITKLHEVRTNTNQHLTEFAYVFPKGSLYPTSYEEFWAERQNPNRKRYTAQADFFLQRPIRGGKVKQKLYAFAEDFDWQLDKWIGQDVVLLDLNESISADYIYDRDIKKIWGDKTPLLT